MFEIYSAIFVISQSIYDLWEASCGVENFGIYVMEFIRSGRGLQPGRLLTLLPTPVDHK